MALNVTIDTEELRALLETGFLLRERGELDKAAEVFDGVIALRPDVDIAHIGLASTRQAQGKNDEAEAAYKRAIECNPQSAVAYAQLGEHYHTCGNKDEALKHLDKAIELDAQGPAGDQARATKLLVDEGIEYSYGLPG